MTLEADIPGVGTTYFDSTQMANIFGFAKMVDKVERITYDSAAEDAFHVQIEGGTVKFKRTKEGLYAYKPPDEY